jgi:hypothetical protein
VNPQNPIIVSVGSDDRVLSFEKQKPLSELKGFLNPSLAGLG